MENFAEWTEILMSAYGLLVTIVAITPTEKDDGALARVKNLFSKFSWIKDLLRSSKKE